MAGLAVPPALLARADEVIEGAAISPSGTFGTSAHSYFLLFSPRGRRKETQNLP
ncbi:hypothetical protein [Bradyrhizobium sp.]|uniref:hypothetical protein n=1 Tax=Bradyrhizobium sp. TaxID=376 RepID=UPI0025B94D80|nr:hypothetical protein [Bradyrhizobium sp.]